MKIVCLKVKTNGFVVSTVILLPIKQILEYFIYYSKSLNYTFYSITASARKPITILSSNKLQGTSQGGYYFQRVAWEQKVGKSMH